MQDAPSRCAVMGRYIFTSRIFQELSMVQPGLQGEIQLTDGIVRLLQHERVFAHYIEGNRYDCGSKLGYLKATVALGLKHSEVAEEFSEYLHDMVQKGALHDHQSI